MRRPTSTSEDTYDLRPAHELQYRFRIATQELAEQMLRFLAIGRVESCPDIGGHGSPHGYSGHVPARVLLQVELARALTR